MVNSHYGFYSCQFFSFDQVSQSFNVCSGYLGALAFSDRQAFVYDSSTYTDEFLDHTWCWTEFCFSDGRGFVINDIFDEKIDRINKGDRQILGNSISLKWAWKLYWILNTLAMLATYVIAYQLELLKYVFLLPLSVILLYFYSSRLKKTAFLGNLCIAILCGFVLWIPFLGESSGLNVIQKNTVSAQFFYCSVVAFFLP